MKYIMVEATSGNTSKDDIREIGQCMRLMQDYNERGFYKPNPELMGYQGFSVPSQEEYETYIENLLIEPDAKIYYARENCCEKEIVGLAIGGLTAPLQEKPHKASGRILFFWSNPKYRKTTMVNNLYKKMWGWFADKKCINVSITFKSFQKDIVSYFEKKGYTMNNVELVGPVKVLEVV